MSHVGDQRPPRSGVCAGAKWSVWQVKPVNGRRATPDRRVGRDGAGCAVAGCGVPVAVVWQQPYGTPYRTFQTMAADMDERGGGLSMDDLFEDFVRRPSDTNAHLVARTNLLERLSD